MVNIIKKNIKIIILTVAILVSLVPVGIEIKENRVVVVEKSVFALTEDEKIELRNLQMRYGDFTSSLDELRRKQGTGDPTQATRSEELQALREKYPDLPEDATLEQARARDKEAKKAIDDNDVTKKGGFLGALYSWFAWGMLLIPTLIKQFAAFLLWLAGVFLNFSVYIGITQMGKIIGDSVGIKSAWGIVRDIVNIFFIFGLLYLSVMTIIGGWSDNIKKRLSLLIIAGLLINFSFFFTSIFVDISNVITLSIYEKMDKCQQPDMTKDEKIKDELSFLKYGGLANCFSKKLGFGSTLARFSTPTDDEMIKAMDRDLTLGQKIMTVLFAAIIFIIVAIVFTAIAVTIFGRFMIIIFLLITSPIMFAGWVLPKLEEHTSAWTKKLGEQLIFLPAMFLMLYIGYELSGTLLADTVIPNTGIGSETAFSRIFANLGTPLIVALINLIITLGFIIGALIIGKKLGAVGMEVASLIGFGAVAAIGAGTLGAAGAGLSKFGSREGAGRISRKLGMAGEWASRRSFDVRQLPGAQTTLKNVGFDPGKPSKAAAGGYRARGEAKGAALLEREEAYGKFRPADQQATKDNVNERANRLTGERSDVKAKKTELGSVDADINRAETDLKKMQSDAAKLDAEIEELKKQDWDPNIKVDIQKKQESRAKMTGAIAAQQSLVSSAKGRKEDISKELGQIISKHSQADTERALQSFGGVYKNKHAVQAQVKKMKKGEMDKLKEELIKQMKKDSAAESNK